MIVDYHRALSTFDRRHLLGLPTETVYGLAAPIDRPELLKMVFALKKRPFFDPLIVHVSSVFQAKALSPAWDDFAQSLAESFWPGPLTMVLPKAKSIDPLITSGLDTVGIRCPKHPLALEFLRDIKVPVAAPSANLFGHTSPTTAEHVVHEFQGTNVEVLDGGPCAIGLESTVLRIEKDDQVYKLSILRPGAVSKADLLKALQKQRRKFEFIDAVESAHSPGALKHHYMPKIPLVLVRGDLSERERVQKTLAALKTLPEMSDGVSLPRPDELGRWLELVLDPDPVMAARQLYSELRRLEESGADALWMKIQEVHQSEGWQAIWNRLEKAAIVQIS